MMTSRRTASLGPGPRREVLPGPRCLTVGCPAPEAAGSDTTAARAQVCAFGFRQGRSSRGSEIAILRRCANQGAVPCYACGGYAARVVALRCFSHSQ